MKCILYALVKLRKQLLPRSPETRLYTYTGKPRCILDEQSLEKDHPVYFKRLDNPYTMLYK